MVTEKKKTPVKKEKTQIKKKIKPEIKKEDIIEPEKEKEVIQNQEQEKETSSTWKEESYKYPQIIITKRKINWIGINRKLRDYGKMLKIHNMNLPEVKIFIQIKNYPKTIWIKYCNWFNSKFNKEMIENE